MLLYRGRRKVLGPEVSEPDDGVGDAGASPAPGASADPKMESKTADTVLVG